MSNEGAPCRHCGAPVNPLLNVCFACGEDQGGESDESRVFRRVEHICYQCCRSEDGKCAHEFFANLVCGMNPVIKCAFFWDGTGDPPESRWKVYPDPGEVPE